MKLDGKALAERIRAEHAADVDLLIRSGRRPHLVAFQVGDDLATAAYIRGQRRGADAWNIGYEVRKLPATATEADIRAAIASANEDPTVTGVLLQLPVPLPLQGRALQREIAPAKDVEGVHPENLGLVVAGRESRAPCTALAAIALLQSSGATIRGSEAVVVGHSEIVGKPIALMLLARDATTTVCHKDTKDLAYHTRRADLLVVAVGKPHLIQADMVKAGAVVVDVGINTMPLSGSPGKTHLVGDVDFDAILAKGCAVTPVPGGVGPVTVAMLLRNTVMAAKRLAPPGDEANSTLAPKPA